MLNLLDKSGNQVRAGDEASTPESSFTMVGGVGAEPGVVASSARGHAMADDEGRFSLRAEPDDEVLVGATRWPVPDDGSTQKPRTLKRQSKGSAK